MTRAEWINLLMAVPATVITTLVALAWILREKADAWVFRVLGRNHGRWVEEARQVSDFQALFEAGRIVPEVREMREAMDRRLDELVKIPEELAMIRSTVGHFTESVDRLSDQIKGLPERLAVVEDRVVGGRRRRAP